MDKLINYKKEFVFFTNNLKVQDLAFELGSKFQKISNFKIGTKLNQEFLNITLNNEKITINYSNGVLRINCEEEITNNIISLINIISNYSCKISRVGFNDYYKINYDTVKDMVSWTKILGSGRVKEYSQRINRLDSISHDNNKYSCNNIEEILSPVRYEEYNPAGELIFREEILTFRKDINTLENIKINVDFRIAWEIIKILAQMTEKFLIPDSYFDGEKEIKFNIKCNDGAK